MKKYDGPIPPCGIFCGGCPRYDNGKKNSCSGAADGCLSRKCRSIYGCCVEKKGLSACFQCDSFPCARFKKFRESWLKLGEDLIENQSILKKYGENRLREHFNGLILED